jgi:hypothetical protein
VKVIFFVFGLGLLSLDYARLTLSELGVISKVMTALAKRIAPKMKKVQK